MTRNLKALGLALLAVIALAALTASAASAFGLKDLDVYSAAKDGTPAVQAASHPYSITTKLSVETTEDPKTGKLVPAGEPKDIKTAFPPGLAGNPTAVPRCTSALFLEGIRPQCPDATAIGIAKVEYGEPEEPESNIVPVYNLYPPPGKAAQIGFLIEGRAPVTIDFEISPDYPYEVIANSADISQTVFFLGASITVWGIPASHDHDADRGNCARTAELCSVSLPETPFITLPSSCAAPLAIDFEADSWQNPNPAEWFKAQATAHDNLIPPNPLSPSGCDKPGFDPEITTQPTSTSAESGSGLDVEVTVSDPAIANPSEEAVSESTIKKTVLTLPEGVTINPSQAEGLRTCSEAQLGAERFDSAPGEGCPQASKIGTIEVQTPLLEGKLLKGSLFVATPYQNPFGTLIALYMVIREPELGILIRQPVKVEPDPRTGQLVSTVDNLPDLPVSRFHLHFREGGRSPLITPPRCATYTSTAVFYPWSDPSQPHPVPASFAITSGVGAGPCPPGGVPPFAPRLEGGTASNAAGAYSPFYMRLTRKDGEQDMTRFSAILPPGVVAKIAAIPFCADAAIEAAKAKSGLEEIAAPSCPAASQIGRTLVGAGVGSELTYVPGQIYLAGPYGGAPLSVAVITPAVAGPFDAGTVVVREGLALNPLTGVAEVDGAASDPIPHILQGIVLKVRDIRIYTDRPQFTLNATNCEEEQLLGTLFGSFADVFDPADDQPAALAARYQAADCANLRFGPRLSLSLKGGTRRGDHPALHAVLRARAGDANVARVATTLPPSEFIDNAHIKNPCTRVQFNANQCPPGSVLGSAKVFTPLLDAPLQGPVYFRSNGGERLLPDIVADLGGQFHITLVGFVDSKNARIRTTFAATPDAPFTKAIFDLKGGKAGLLVNSRDLCANRLRAKVAIKGQNGRRTNSRPVVGTSCKKAAAKQSRAQR